jgi:hypothetical protein
MTEPKAPKTMWEWMRDRYLERQARKKAEQEKDRNPPAKT